MTRSTLHELLVDILADGQRLGAFPSAGAWVAQGGQKRAVAFCGEATPETLWDVASLTKPMVTVEVAMEAVSRGLMRPDEPILEHLDSRVTLRDLLAHRGGFPAWDDLFDGVSRDLNHWKPGGATTLEWVSNRCQRLHDGSLETRYSDLGYITLAWTLQERFGSRLDALAPRWSWSGNLDGDARRRRCLPTGWCNARQRTAQGEVNDTNCWVLGGIAGHAGVFATLNDVASWAMELLNTDRGRTASRDRGVLQMFWDRANRVGDQTWVMGWDTPSPGQSTAGSRVSASTVGHLGFTGTSLWIDREADALVVLLSNRVEHGPESKPLMRAFRPRFHDIIFDALSRD